MMLNMKADIHCKRLRRKRKMSLLEVKNLTHSYGDKKLYGNAGFELYKEVKFTAGLCKKIY